MGLHFQRGVTTSEDQPQAIVAHRNLTQHLFFRIQPEILLQAAETLEFLLLLFESSTTPEQVDRFVSSSGNEPGARVLRKSVARPVFERNRECFLSHLLGQIEITEEANQSC